MIRERSKTRIKLLESKVPKGGSKNAKKIGFTPEAWALIEPYAKRFEELDGQTLIYTPAKVEGCISLRTPVSVVVNYALWIRTLGSAEAVISTQYYYEIPEEKRPSDMRGMPDTEIDKRMVEFAIEHFIEIGIEI